MKFYRDIVEAHPNSKIYDKCWDGYRKVPGKSRGEKGSCEKISNEAYDAWDEFDMWYQFDATTKKLKQKTWYHAQEREARADGWHDSHDKAMRAHGYFPSKFKKGEYVVKGADGKWIKVYPYADKGMSEELNELSNTDQESYYRFLMAKVKTGRTLSKQEKEFIKTYQFYKMSVAEGSLNEFAPGDGEDDPEDDPYKYPKPESYRRSIDFFGRFEADHFDDEMFDEKTGVFKGYWEDEESRVQIAYFKFDDPTRTGSDDPGMGWYYEPASDGNSNNTSAKPAVDTTAHRKQQELGMIDAFLKSGKKPQPGSQIHSLMKKHGLAEGIDPYRLERLDPQTRRVLTRMADHKEPGSWLSASEAYATSLGLQYKSRDPRGWEQDVQRYVDLYRQYSGQGVAEGGESGAYYYERLAQRVFDADPNLDASGRAEAVLDAGWTIMVADLGEKTAYSTLNYNEDFASDFVSAYADLQQQGKNKTMTKETQAMTDNSLGYKNTLAVMKAADSSQQATINLGGEPVTLDYPEARFIAGKYKAFLRAGRQEEFFGLMADPAKFDGMMKQLRGLVDKQKNFRGSVPGDRGVPGETQTPWIREGESQYDKSHGSPYDRGGADSWYNRARRPHKGGVGGDSGERSLDLTPDEIEAYHAGYDDNEKSGGKKQWESVKMKIQDIITENQAGVQRGRLNEFAPGGSEGNGPFEYGTAIIQIGEDFVDTYSDEGAGADAAAIIKVGRKFMSAGMKAGIQAFYAMDTQVRDHVAEELEDQGFNVRQDIYEPYDQLFTAAEAARGIETILALLKEFAKTVEEPEDRKTVAGIYKAFQQGMEPGFVALHNAYEFDIDADFYDFARDRGIDLDQVAARAGFDTDSLHEGKQGVSEGMRLVGKHGEGAKTAKVYKDHEWGEFRVKFYTDGKHEGEEADYHTDDKDDANDTAKSWTTKGEKVAESTYWCRQDKTRKLIPEGYKKTARGYITKL
jgi:hypothetical protein